MVIRDFDENWPYKKGSFVKFMNRILKYSQPQRSIRLFIHTLYRSIRIQNWISRVLTHRLAVLEVQILAPGIVIPCSLLNSICLQDLKLDLYEGTLNVAALNCAPNLTSLCIMGVNIVNENLNSSTTMKFSFPSLEICRLQECKWLNVKSVELRAPSLTAFISEPLGEYVEYDYSIVILAPRLATFKCGSCNPENFILDGSSVVSADFDCDDMFSSNLELLTSIGIRVRNLLNDFKNLEELHLSSFAVEVSQLGPLLQRHDKVRQLTVSSQIKVEHLLQLLLAAPSLKLLRLNVCDWTDYDYEMIESVPSCMVSHLEEIRFEAFYCEKPQYNLLKFLSTNGEKLKKLTMCALPHEMQNEVQEFVSAFRNVEFEFEL